MTPLKGIPSFLFLLFYHSLACENFIFCPNSPSYLMERRIGETWRRAFIEKRGVFRKNILSRFKRLDMRPALGLFFDKFQPLWGNKGILGSNVKHVEGDYMSKTLKALGSAPAPSYAPSPYAASSSSYGSSSYSPSSPYSSSSLSPSPYAASPYSSSPYTASPYSYSSSAYRPPPPSSPYGSSPPPYGAPPSPYGSPSLPYQSPPSYPVPASPYSRRPTPPPYYYNRSYYKSPPSPYRSPQSTHYPSRSGSPSYSRYSYRDHGDVPPPPPSPYAPHGSHPYHQLRASGSDPVPSHESSESSRKSNSEGDLITIGGIGQIIKLIGGLAGATDGKGINVLGPNQRTQIRINEGKKAGSDEGPDSAPNPFIKIGDSKISFKPTSAGIQIAFGSSDKSE